MRSFIVRNQKSKLLSPGLKIGHGIREELVPMNRLFCFISSLKDAKSIRWIGKYKFDWGLIRI